MTQDRILKTLVQENRPSGSAMHGLRSPGILGRVPVLGLVLFLSGGLIFGLLAYNLGANPSLSQWDMAVASTFRAAQVKAPWPWMEDLLFGLFIGKEVAVLIGTVLAVYFLHKRFWRELAMVLAGLGGGGLIWYLLSHYFDRPRPEDHLEVLQLSGPSFPSAPALIAILCFGLLAYLLVARLPSLFWKWFSGVMCTLAIAMVALSSLFFGTHYPTDVIAGNALGLAWAGFAYTLVERIFQPGTRVSEEVSQRAITLEGLRTPGFFGTRPLVGITLILLCSLSLVALGYGVLANGALVQLDMSVYQALLAQARGASPLVNDLMLFGFFVGKQAVQVIVATLSLYFLYQRSWRELVMLQASTQGGGFIWNFLIDFFARPRPPEQLGLATSAIPSFPSGHALGTIICYGFLAYLLVPRMPSRFWKWALGIFILAIVLFEGFSRMFHGNHYLTDVLAAYVLGIGWMVLVCTTIELILFRRKD